MFGRGPPSRVTSALPWGPGTATGVGSMPGVDPVETVRVVLGELPDLPFLPELPGRGAHADIAGRSTALLAGLTVDVQPGGWRLTPRRSRSGQQARDDVARDLDALEETAAAGPPPLIKLACAGPWTLAALLELPRGEKVLSDHGAVIDLAASLAEGLALHVADVGRRLPGTTVLLQLDEPLLPAVLAARVKTASGVATLRAPQTQVARTHLATVLGAVPDPARSIVHCCAPHPPVSLLREAGAGSVSLDATLLTPVDDDALGTAVEGGTGLLLGCAPGASTGATLAPVRRLWARLGLDPALLAPTVVITPTCGLAGATPGRAREALGRCAEAARALADAPL